MEEALSAWLIEALATDAINWLDRPSAILPAITLQVIDAGTEYTHAGKSDLPYARVQADVWGASYKEAKLLAREYIAAIEAGADRPTALFFEAIEVNNRDMPPEMLDGGSKVFRVLLEHLVPHKLKGQ